MSDTLKNAPFESKRAVEIMGELNKKAPILNNTSSLLEKLTAINPKAKELQQGQGTHITSALMTMKRNLAIERLKSLLPVLGNDASLKNHIRNAINNAGDLKSVINNLEKIEIKDAPENSTKLLEAFKNEVKALREEAQTGEIKGDNFITKESPAPKSDLNVKISVDDWVRELSEINNNELSANLFILQNKHPELFKKPSDVYRLLKEIKNNPTHFFKNNRPDIALIAKVLEDGSVGKLGIVKESGLVGHLSKSTNKNEMDRLRKVNEKELKVGTPYPTLQRADVNQVGPTAGAKSTFSSSDESIIPQKDKNTKTINASPHIASGLLGGTANGADENGNVSPEEFAKGFVYALFGSKITAEGVKRVSPELYNKILSISKKPSEEVKNIVDNAGVDKLAKQEKRGIYNVTYNGKNSTQIKQDLDNINDAIKYERGNIGKGAKHISIRHLDDENKAGFVTKEELLNLGENVRNFIKEHKEPFVNKENARIYEWEDDKGVRFKLVVSNKNGEGRGLPLGKSQDVSSITNDLRPATKKGLSPSGSLDDIITFYSDRNLKEPMKFENPKLKLLDAIDTSSDKVGLVKKVLLNKDISDGVKTKAVNRLTKNKISQGAKTSYISTKNSENN